MIKAKDKLQEKVRLSFASRAKSKRPAFVPTIIFLTTEWLIVISLLSFSLFGILHHFPQPGLVTSTSIAAVVLLAVLSIFTVRYIGDFTANYQLELTDTEMILKNSEKQQKTRVDRMKFNDVAFVEYFSPSDNAAFLFHGKDGRIISVPSWSLTGDPSAIEEFLKQKKLPIKKV